MYKKIFLDANIILDTFDSKRPSHHQSAKAYLYALENDIELLTSCDIITTLFYVHRKQEKKTVLEKIQNTNKIVKLIEFSNQEVDETCKLMLLDITYNDIEDTIQYILAKRENCDLILSNDKKFISKEIPLMTSDEFVKKHVTD